MKRRHSESSASDDRKVLSYIELYAGVGGWSMALERAVVSYGWKVHCLAALDHSDLCAHVYRHNFPDNRYLTKPIEKLLTVDQMIQWSADILLMSPPCQPHSRQHDNNNRDLDDPRSQSFLHICQLIKQLPTSSLPKLIFVENVVGFEASASRRIWMDALRQQNYQVGEFHLSPTQVGIPNDRPRYFCVAVLESHLVREDSSTGLPNYLRGPSEETHEEATIQSNISGLGISSADETSQVVTEKIGDYLDAEIANRCPDNLRIPQKLLTRNAAWCFDIVTPESSHSACFTSSYGKFVRGTGSVLYTGPQPERLLLVRPEDREFDNDWHKGLDLENHLRYFSGEELAHLFGFSSRFSFPAKISLKQKWKLVGNSLSVPVASKMIELGLRLLLRVPVRQKS